MSKRVEEVRRAVVSNKVPRWALSSRKTSHLQRSKGVLFDGALDRVADFESQALTTDAPTETALCEGYVEASRLAPDETARVILLIDDRGGNGPHHWGHREHLRTRFLKGGHTPMPEYEVLELLLFNAVPRDDVKPLAKRLLQEFGDLSGVVGASQYRLLKIERATKQVYYQLRLVEAFSERLSKAKLRDRDVLSSWDALVSYCRSSMSHRESEQFRVLFLDRRNGLIADEVQGQGTVDHVTVYPREVAKRALELNATAIILVHNHPSGDPTPSDGDVEMTYRVESACATIGVEVHDHIVVGRGKECSLRTAGLI